MNARRANRLLSIALVLGAIAFARTSVARRAWAARSPLAFYALAGVVMFVLALGPEPKAWGRDVLYRAPYWWLMQLPGFDSVRVPARFGQLMIVALAPALGLAFARLFAPRHRAAWIIAGAVLAEGWLPAVPVVRLPDAPKVPAAVVASGAVTLEMPVSSDFAPNTRALLNAMRQGQPMINGFGGYIPAHYHLLRLGLEARDASVLATLREKTPIATYVYRAEDPGGSLQTLVSHQPGAESAGSDAQGDWVLLPAIMTPSLESSDDAIDLTRPRTSSRGDAAGQMLDHNPMTAWQSDRVPGTPDQIDFDFGRPIAVSAIELSLGPFTGNYPRDLEISATDGNTVTPVWRGSVVGLALKAALQAKDIPIRIAIPKPIAARSLRLTNVWHESNPEWSIAELRVFGRRVNRP